MGLISRPLGCFDHSSSSKILRCLRRGCSFKEFSRVCPPVRQAAAEDSPRVYLFSGCGIALLIKLNTSGVLFGGRGALSSSGPPACRAGSCRMLFMLNPFGIVRPISISSNPARVKHE